MFKYIIITGAVILLIYTRFVHINWGLPYPFHPDERNMADAIVRLNCDQIQTINQNTANTQSGWLATATSCLNPHFFAYGQFPLYLGYFMILFWHWLKASHVPVSFYEAILTLRIISAVSSVLTVFIMVKVFQFGLIHISEKQPPSEKIRFIFTIFAMVLLIFSPVLIQFAHFGTTESLLIFFYVVLVYVSLKVINDMEKMSFYLLISGIICGLAMATKVSSIVYAGIPAYCLLHERKSGNNFYERIIFRIVSLARFTTVLMFIGIFLSPYNLIAFEEFTGSFQYESSVALGKLDVFYTRQFHQTIPVLFQFKTIFPFVLGWGILALFIIGFFILPFRNKYINMLRVSFILTFLPNAFVYAKWTRFIAPVYTVMIVCAALLLFFLFQKIQNLSYETKKIALFFIAVIVFVISVPGIAYLSIYQNQDVRFVASDWIYKNMAPDSYILSETANVIDLPIPSPDQLSSARSYELPSYKYKSFNFYDLDTEPSIQQDLPTQVQQADYIFIPSRRLFFNHTCYEVDDPYISSPFLPSQSASNIRLQQFMDDACMYRLSHYPLLNQYYKNLFFGSSGFTEVAQFSSYPRIQLFGKTILEFPDENAEETWTVFDHPVIRIYKKVQAES